MNGCAKGAIKRESVLSEYRETAMPLSPSFNRLRGVAEKSD